MKPSEMAQLDRSAIQARAESAVLQGKLYLASKGVSWNALSLLDDEDVHAYVIALGIAEGGVFDWDAWAWKRPRA